MHYKWQMKKGRVLPEKMKFVRKSVQENDLSLTTFNQKGTLQRLRKPVKELLSSLMENSSLM